MCVVVFLAQFIYSRETGWGEIRAPRGGDRCNYRFFFCFFFFSFIYIYIFHVSHSLLGCGLYFTPFSYPPRKFGTWSPHNSRMTSPISFYNQPVDKDNCCWMRNYCVLKTWECGNLHIKNHMEKEFCCNSYSPTKKLLYKGDGCWFQLY